MLPDGAQAGKGPLAGLAAGLAWAAGIGAGSLLTVPVDTPLIPRQLLTALTPPPAAASYQGRRHHLVALWPVSILPALISYLQQSQTYKVHDFAAGCGIRDVKFAGAADPFLNINTPADLAAAAARLIIES